MGSTAYHYPPDVRRYEIIGALFGKPYRVARCGAAGLTQDLVDLARIDVTGRDLLSLSLVMWTAPADGCSRLGRSESA
jgi:hypothetical protein